MAGRATAWIIAAVLIIGASVAQAAPITGIYQSQELGGTILDGRWSESWIGGIKDSLGNTIHSASFDGTTLGGMWEISGVTLSEAPVVISAQTHFGHTDTTLLSVFGGGVLTLMPSGTWNSAGDGAYIVDITSYEQVTTRTTSMATGKSTDINEISLSGTFRDYPGYTVSFAVAASAPLGSGTSVPANFPTILPTGTATSEWGVIQKMTMELVPEPCVIVLLAGAGVGLLRRRRRK